MSQLGTLEDLPLDYRQGLTARNLVPLWPALRAALPYGIPARKTKPILWRYEEIRPQLLEAGRLTPIEKAERRVLVLANPGLGLDNMQATPSIYIGMQLILPGEIAPNHRHSPSAVRFVIEGEGGFTIVEGEKCPMEPGDLILTPSGLWHEHGHSGSGPVIWMDALDLPMVYALEASYGIEGKPQTVRNEADGSQTRYRRSGLVPYAAVTRPRANYPLVRFPWREVKSALADLATVTPRGEAVRLAYVNPETGMECMPILGFSAVHLRPGESLRLPRHSASSVINVVDGSGTARIDGVELSFDPFDTMAVPTHAEVEIANASATTPAHLFVVDDAPMQRKLGFYEIFG
ncbi:cupin domain-containing protein [Pinisolibacter sp. B13]|uniref:cupin domain-containing protein n=2 Tax=Pinisolibacter aquiterrae TaxID=2815579 RepID=UPI001C3E0933|nr:cupin domain-containing protein [Pinisolibacter aquiterrae]MBV5263866.1 cupin domain-containing protein [Pinisolibacter aquiterrae]